MKCYRCAGEIKESTTTYFVDLKGLMVIVKNVPCWECEQCGETTFDDTVVEQLEIIIEKVKSLYTEIAVVEYNTAA